MLELNKSIIISTHVYSWGPAQDLRDYLVKNKIKKVIFIGHPLFFDPKLQGSGYELYGDGKKIQQYYGKIKKSPLLISLLHDLFFTIFWTLRFGKKWDVFFGSDNLNAMAGVILKKCGFVKTVIYYVIDYNPQRFENKILNYAYHWIDRFCVKYSDETWNVSPRMSMARKKYFNFTAPNQKTVPIGMWFKRIKRLNFSDIEKQTLVYLGHVIKKQGIQHIIGAIPLIVKKIPNFKFVIIGDGDYLYTLKKQTEKLRVTKYVLFLGYIKDNTEVENLLAKCVLAVAPYEREIEGLISYTYFADPGKIKLYLAAGLPVIMTDVPYNAKDLVKNQCAKIVELNNKDITKVILDLMTNDKRLNEYRINAVKYASKFDWDLIFETNLKRVFDI